MERAGQHQQLAVADVPLALFDPGDDQRSHLHAHQIDLPGQVLLPHGRLLHGPTQPDPLAADISIEQELLACHNHTTKLSIYDNYYLVC